ncbi:MAG: hypothetical protein LBV41_05650 [Cytophagaceae bacterium]|jgi:hypothetical protein|nr:hypothetical protein [Cytophagaceae bacterium]
MRKLLILVSLIVLLCCSFNASAIANSNVSDVNNVTGTSVSSVQAGQSTTVIDVTVIVDESGKVIAVIVVVVIISQ